MTIGSIMHPCKQEEVIPEGKRLRMKDWLKIRIGNPRYPGLVWLDEEQQIFKIPWKHAALHGWDQNSDGALFRDWAEHTGSCVHNAHPKTLKATFRCALHSLPDVHEDKTLAKKRGDDACRVFRFSLTASSAPRKRHIRIRNHKKPMIKNLTRNQIEEATQAMNNSSMNYSQSPFTWNYTSQNTSTCTNTSSAFSQSQLPSTIATSFPTQPSSWAVQGGGGSILNPPAHGLTTPSSMSMASGFNDEFKPMHQSMTDPNISPYYQTENLAIFNRTSHMSQSQNTREDFSAKIHFDEKTLYPPPVQGSVSPSSISVSDPGTSPYYFPEYCGQSNSPSAVYSPGFNNQNTESFFQNNQNDISSPLNSEYLPNSSPASSVISCATNSQVNSDYMQLGNQRNVLSECSVISPSNQRPDYEILNDFTKAVQQGSRSPYYGDTITSAALPSTNVQQAVDEFAFVPSGAIQPHAEVTVVTKELTDSNLLILKENDLEALENCKEGLDNDIELNANFTLPFSLLENNQMSFGSHKTNSSPQRTKLPAIETLCSL